MNEVSLKLGFYGSVVAFVAAVAYGIAQIAQSSLDYDGHVCDYWPEFAKNGKEMITVRQLLSHQAALLPLAAHDVRG